MMSDRFVVRFWGVRGSYPVPGPRTLTYGGNTPCIEITAGSHTIILDGGTGLINLGSDLVARSSESGEPVRATLLFSHTHHDHTQGIPYFAPAYVGSSNIYMFGPRFFQNELAEAIAKTMLPPNFPIGLSDLPSRMEIRNLRENEQIFLWPGRDEPQVRNRSREPLPEGSDEAVRIDVTRSYAHPQEGVYFYRVSYRGHAVVYATDTEGYVGGDQRLVQFARGADLLIHDAHYTPEEYLNPQSPRQGWGHSTPQMALEIARAAAVQRVAFFHLNPLHTDDMLAKIESEMKAEYPGAMVAAEGLEVDLTGPPPPAALSIEVPPRPQIEETETVEQTA